MKLIPFHKMFAETVMDWQLDPDQRRFFRGLDRYMTLDECAEFDKKFTDLFMVVENNAVIGMASAKLVCKDVYEIGVLVKSELQKKGRGTWIAKLIEDYLFHVKQCRSILIYVSKEHGLNRVCEKDLGYTFAGMLKSFTFVNGQFEDIFIFQKLR